VKPALPRVRAFLLLSVLCIGWHQTPSQEKPQEKPQEAAADASVRKNPVKPTPENLAEAKKYFGYDCAMCHGVTGDGKGDLAPSMGLKMIDWRDTSTIAGMSDSEMFDLIVKGKGKMVGEGDRISTEMVWKVVNYVRTLAKKEPAKEPSAVPKAVK
jgi:mono/diheme cytochrome c family protein